MDIDCMMSHWLTWRDRLDELEIKRATGVKPNGIEYRLMLEAAQIHLDPKKPWIHQQMVQDVDTVWKRIYQLYPDEMRAIEIYYLRKRSFRAVRESMGISQHMSRKWVLKGIDLMCGGLAVVSGYEN